MSFNITKESFSIDNFLSELDLVEVDTGRNLSDLLKSITTIRKRVTKSNPIRPNLMNKDPTLDEVRDVKDAYKKAWIKEGKGKNKHKTDLNKSRKKVQKYVRNRDMNADKTVRTQCSSSSTEDANLTRSVKQKQHDDDILLMKQIRQDIRLKILVLQHNDELIASKDEINHIIIEDKFDSKPHHSLEVTFDRSRGFTPVTMTELDHAVHYLKEGKAADVDFVKSGVMKKAVRQCPTLFLDAINKELSECSFSSGLKEVNWPVSVKAKDTLPLHPTSESL